MQRHFAEVGDIFEAGKGAMATKNQQVDFFVDEDDEVQLLKTFVNFKTQTG